MTARYGEGNYGDTLYSYGTQDFAGVFSTISVGGTATQLYRNRTILGSSVVSFVLEGHLDFAHVYLFAGNMLVQFSSLSSTVNRSTAIVGSASSANFGLAGELNSNRVFDGILQTGLNARLAELDDRKLWTDAVPGIENWEPITDSSNIWTPVSEDQGNSKWLTQ